jgi:hypothetical protein
VEHIMIPGIPLSDCAAWHTSGTAGGNEQFRLIRRETLFKDRSSNAS